MAKQRSTKQQGSNDARFVNGQVRLSVPVSQRIIKILMEDGKRKMTVSEISEKLGRNSNDFVLRVIRGDSVLTAQQLGMLIDSVGVAIGAGALQAIKDLTLDDVKFAVEKTFLRAKRGAISGGIAATKKAFRGAGGVLSMAGELLKGLGK